LHSSQAGQLGDNLRTREAGTDVGRADFLDGVPAGQMSYERALDAWRAGAGFVEDRLQVVLDGVGGERSRRPISLPFSARLGGGRMALRTS
jgi:hypothetical protein